MKTRHILFAFLALMVCLIAIAIIIQKELILALRQPGLYNHARFVHIAATGLFFANAVLGMIWERRSLASGSKEVILQNYKTVSWLYARLSSPLIIVSVLSGLMLSFIISDLWEIGWLSVSFLLFIASGLVWVISDIPTQYKVKSLMASLKPEDQSLPQELVKLLKLRWWIGLAGVMPLAVVLAFMVYKPELPAVASWFR